MARETMIVNGQQCSPSEVNAMWHKKQRENKNCFVATACYGDINAPEVNALREWRDDILANHIFGRVFIRLYYRHGPYLAAWINKHRATIPLARRFLNYIVAHIGVQRRK